MNPSHIVGLHRREAVVGLVEIEELALLLHEREVALEGVAPAVVLALELPARARGLLARVVLPHELVPRCRQMLWNARTWSSAPRTTMIDVRAASISLVK